MPNKVGDKIVITASEEGFFEVGDTGVLTRKDANGDWWADLNERSWSDGDNEFCLEAGLSEFSIV